MENSRLSAFHDQLKKDSNRIFGEDAFFVVAISGGPDSMALLYLFKKAGLKCIVVHINYGKRGKNSDLDQELVEQMAYSWGYECLSVRLNSDDTKGENFQNWARNERYKIFRDLRQEYKADAIVTAHHQDDQIETILQKLFRGSSPSAWQAMKRWNGEIFRPLITFSKQQILNFCEDEAVPYRIDESNLESSFARNLIRSELAPQLDAYFPGWKQNILKLPAYGSIFEESTAIIAKKISQENHISLGDYQNLTPHLRIAVMKLLLEEKAAAFSFSKGQLEQLAKLDELQTGKALEVGELLIFRSRNELVISDKREQQPIRVLITKEKANDDFVVEDIKLGLSDTADGDLNLDADALQWPLTLRDWQPGDYFRPLGLKGHQKISVHLTNRKISSAIKEKALVLCGSDGTIYALIYPEKADNKEKGAISELAKIQASTKKIMTIKSGK